MKLQSIGRTKSCTSCRQARVACDARKTLTGQCSQCRLKQLDCRFDANFKRVSTRRLVHTLVSSICNAILTKQNYRRNGQELHALLSGEDAAYTKPFVVKTIPSSQIIWHGNTAAPAKPARGPALLWLSIRTQPVLMPWVLLKLMLRLPLNYSNSIHCQPSIFIFC